MKNALKLLGIAALVAVAGFSFLTCSNSSNSATGGGGGYSATVVRLEEGAYKSLFTGEKVPALKELIILSGAKADLTVKVSMGMVVGDVNDELTGTGLSYADIDTGLQSTVTDGYITSGQKAQLLGLLNSQGYGVVATGLGDMGEAGKNYIGIIAAYKE